MNDSLIIPKKFIEEWQSITDLMAKIIGIPAGLVMRIVDENIEVFVSSDTLGNPYNPGDSEHLYGSGLYCEMVIKNKGKLLVPNALKDENWKNNPDVKLNMISYLGFPILYPDGNLFGTICVLDNKENSYTPLYEELMKKLKYVIENNLALIYMNKQLGDENKRLNDYVSEIKQLRNIIPICANCKKIRDDGGFWQNVETYFSTHSGVDFTHGLCPDCVDLLYPEISNDSNM